MSIRCYRTFSFFSINFLGLEPGSSKIVLVMRLLLYQYSSKHNNNGKRNWKENNVSNYLDKHPFCYHATHYENTI